MIYPIAQLERRFTAFAIDRLVGWGLLALVGVGTATFVSDELWTVVCTIAGATVVLWLAFAVALGVGGVSPGKAVTGLRVVHHGTGTPIGVGPALVRALVLGVSGLPTFGIGIATLAWTAVEDRGRQRRGWHDHLAHTVVVDVRPVPDDVEDEVDAGPRHIVNLTAMRLIPAPPVEAPATPERSELSMRRQPLPADVIAPPPRERPQPPSPQQWKQPVAAAPPAWRPSVQRPQTGPGPGAAARWRVHFDNGESFVIAGMALVGRRPEARHGEQVAHLVPLTSPDMSVSKTHAQFGPASDGTIVVMDRGSTNGTQLVRQGVSRQLAPGKPAALVDGDKVVYGDREMILTREA